MNLLNIISEIEKADPEFTDRISPRRDAIKNITSFGSKVAVAAAPFAFLTLFKKAYGATATTSVTDVLNFALTLEYLESYFYNQGVAKSGLIPSKDLPHIGLIKTDENLHVKFLQTALAGAAITSPKFDLTAHGTFPTVLTDYQTFLAVANAFEDTGVRAYKGQAPNLVGNQAILTAALSIHAVEARHASYIRQLRASYGVAIKPWITGSATEANDIGVPQADANYAAGAAGYPAENNIVQAGVTLTGVASHYGSTTPYNVCCEAFDEPLDMASVVTIVTPFFATSN